jgi:hypothetical protein
MTHRSHFDNYEVLGIPELWRYNGSVLDVLILEGDRYRSSELSSQFPNFPIKQIIPEYLMRSKIEGRNKTMRAFRASVRSGIQRPDLKSFLSSTDGGVEQILHAPISG